MECCRLSKLSIFLENLYKYRIWEIFRGRKLLCLLKHQTIHGKTFVVPAPLYICLAPQIYKNILMHANLFAFAWP